jgi:hypothetical protein
MSTTNSTTSSKLSEFIRNATPEEKERVYTEVMTKATERQNAIAGGCGMSETPETDAVYERVKCSDEDYDAFIDMTHFARQLERQRDEAVALLRDATNQIAYLHGKFQETGSGNSVIQRCISFLATLDRTEKTHDR